jgi:hypothetical protein
MNRKLSNIEIVLALRWAVHQVEMRIGPDELVYRERLREAKLALKQIKFLLLLK